jgi:signal transduction histidine kinase
MKNPLTPIRLAVAQLARAPSPATRDAIEVLTAESERLEQLAREFTEFGRLPEGPAAPVDLCELLEELVRTSVPPTMTARLTLDPATPVLRGHYDPLRRALANIVRNAVEACDGQGELEILAEPVASGARLMIRDHGPGIPPELEGRIFDPYCTGKEGGTGLGLALAKQTVEHHQGSIAVERTPGGGATFIVRLSGL